MNVLISIILLNINYIINLIYKYYNILQMYMHTKQPNYDTPITVYTVQKLLSRS